MLGVRAPAPLQNGAGAQPGPATVKLTVAAAGKVWLACAPLAVAPSPKSHSCEVMSPLAVLVKVTGSSATGAAGALVKAATSGAGGGVGVDGHPQAPYRRPAAAVDGAHRHLPGGGPDDVDDGGVVGADDVAAGGLPPPALLRCRAVARRGGEG